MQAGLPSPECVLSLLICYNSRESASHILIHCPYTWEIWCKITKDFGLCFIARENVATLLEGCQTEALNDLGKKIRHLVPAAMCWSVWI